MFVVSLQCTSFVGVPMEGLYPSDMDQNKHGYDILSKDVSIYSTNLSQKTCLEFYFPKGGHVFFAKIWLTVMVIMYPFVEYKKVMCTT